MDARDAKPESQSPVKVPERALSQVAIVTPIFNDWLALDRILAEFDALPGLDRFDLHLIAVDDASSERRPAKWPLSPLKRVASVQVVPLVCNLGHQRAIAIGLVVAAQNDALDYVVVMDSDGEDRPADVARLLTAATANPGCIVLAARAKRSESIEFRAFYAIYKLVFRALTGNWIDFGNFLAMPAAGARALVHSSQIWNNLAAGVIRSRIPAIHIPTDRGSRYAGHSRMSFVDLIVHGLSAMSVYADAILVRIMIFALMLVGIVAVGMMAVVGVKFFTHLAIPGWASNVFGLLSVILLQALIFAGVALFQLLSLRSFKTVIPALDGPGYIRADSRDASISPSIAHR